MRLVAKCRLGLTSAVTKVYPPKTNADLRSLVNHIVQSALDIHHKQALIYYILKDCRAAPDAASQFAHRFHLPEKYRLFIEGLWNLDRLEFRVSRSETPLVSLDLDRCVSAASHRVLDRTFFDPDVSG